MTDTRLAAFLEQVRQSPDLQASLSSAADVAELVEIARTAGFELSADSFDALVDRELAPGEVEAVAGGGPRPHPGCVFSVVYSIWGCGDPPESDDAAATLTSQR